MKKIIASSFVLSTLLGTTPQISNLMTTENTNLRNHHENNLQKWYETVINEMLEETTHKHQSLNDKKTQLLLDNIDGT